MKKILLSIVLVFAIGSVNAQDIKFGVKLGVNSATLNGDFADDLDRKLGLHIGAVAEIALSDTFSLQPELIFSTQGTKGELEDEVGKNEFKINSNYLNFPILAKFFVTEGLSIDAGPQIGFLLSSEVENEYTDFGDSSFNESRTDDNKDFTNGIDFGLAIGLGYKLGNKLNFAARYNLGLSNISDLDDNDFDDDFSQQNNVFQISIGYSFM